MIHSSVWKHPSTRNKAKEEFINVYLHNKRDKHKQDKFGEVFTPPVLIERMLSLFPSHVWSNPNLKWIDPTAGVGFFMIHVYDRLMSGLASCFKDESKRSRHIVEHMLYMVELSKRNCNVCRKLFGKQANVWCGDILSFPFPFAFDCVIGNPPYQDEVKWTSRGKRINGGKHKLYERIFLHMLLHLSEKGWMSLLVPDNLFSGNGNKGYQAILSSTEVRTLNVSLDENAALFGGRIQQPVCYFLLQKKTKKEEKEKEKEKETCIQYAPHRSFHCVLEDRPVNPTRDWSPRVERLIRAFVKNERNEVVYNRGHAVSEYRCKTSSSSGHKCYEVMYSPPSNVLHTNKVDFAPGLNIPKAVLFLISPKFEFVMDYAGKFGLGPNTFMIPFDSVAKGRRLESFLKGDVYRTLVVATQTTRQYLKIALIEHLDLSRILRSSSLSATRKKTQKSQKSQKKRTNKKR